jgi:hypothetical protein
MNFFKKKSGKQTEGTRPVTALATIDETDDDADSHLDVLSAKRTFHKGY